MIKGENFLRNAKCKHGHQSSVSNSAWCDSNKFFTVLKLHDMCHNPKCNCQKLISSTPTHFHFEHNGFENTMKKRFKGTEKMWNNFIKLGFKIATPIISAGVAAKTKKPQSAQIISHILKSLTGGSVPNLTDEHGHKLRVKVL